MPLRAVCISHTTGAGGEGVARRVSERLGFRYLDEEIVTAAAEKEQLDPALIADVERRKSLIVRVLAQLGEAGVHETYPGLTGLAIPTSESQCALIREVIRDAADQGSVVIVAHAASFALEGSNELLRVLVTASAETRSGRLSAAQRITEPEAAKAIREADAARADYLKRFYRVDRELPTHYDLVVNTDSLTDDDAAELVIHAAGFRA
ncbi:MAG: cytidylate kinase-like family protein [Gaiellaceae bacterium]